MMRRRGGPGVLSTMARTAVISATATATANKVNARAAAKAQNAQQAQLAAQQQAAQMQAHLASQEAAIETAVIDDTIARLKELAQLKDAGVLTEEEFTAAKARVLAS